MKFNIVNLPGDGIGNEIIDEGVKVLRAAQDVVSGFELDFQWYDAGAAYYLKTKEALPSKTYNACKEGHAIYLGAMGLPNVVEESGTEVQGRINISLRKELNLFAGVRPVKLYKGVKSCLRGIDNIDFVVLRESSEGLFASFLGGLSVHERLVGDTLVITREGTEKICEYAFKLALKRKGRLSDGKRVVTCCDKANIFKSYAFFRKIYNEVAQKYADQVETDYAYVDAMALWLTQKPDQYDVIVAENMFGDILSDLAGGLVGGMGFAPSGDIGYDHAIFQPAHGSAPTIAGKNIANPAATILSGAMMLDWLADKYNCKELAVAADLIEKAVEDVLADGIHTADIGGNTSTSAFGDAVIAALKNSLSQLD